MLEALERLYAAGCEHAYVRAYRPGVKVECEGGRRRTAPPFPRKGMRSTIGAARMSVRDPGAAGLRGRARRAPVDCAAHTSLNVMASRAIAILAAFVVMMFAVVGCTGLQEQGRGEAAGGEDAAQPAREAKSTTTTSRRCTTTYAWMGLRSGPCSLRAASS
jgi:hypothetical protein